MNWNLTFEFFIILVILVSLVFIIRLCVLERKEKLNIELSLMQLKRELTGKELVLHDNEERLKLNTDINHSLISRLNSLIAQLVGLYHLCFKEISDT